MIEYGLIGEKLGHSFSAEIHRLLGDYQYQLIELDKNELDIFLTRKDFKAVNVTIPYKKAVIPYLDEISDQAKAIGAVNCVKNHKGRLIGHNTDFDGLGALLDHSGVRIKDKKVLILGTGGTSDTAAAVCSHRGAASIIKVSRTPGQKVNRVMTVSYDSAVCEHSDAEIIINTTPCGMYPDIFGQAADIRSFKKLRSVIDVIYNPLRSSLVMQAEKAGLKTEGGLYMLVAQAAAAADFFFSVNEYREKIHSVYKKIYNEKSNIVLTGMPSCGKTTVGKFIAGRTGRSFIDTDVLIEENTGISISHIFSRYGEEFFRDMETEIIKKISSLSGAVIATGGGAVLREENITNLKMNGIVFFLDKDPRDLTPTADRPKALTREEIMRRYRERYNIYMASSDHKVDNNKTAEEAAARILEVLK